MYDLFQKIAKFVPSSVKSLMRKNISFTNYDLYIRTKRDPFTNDPPDLNFSDSPYTLGIIKDFAHYHQANIAACKELRVSYKVLDISGSNWIQVLRESKCDAYLVWPSATLSIWKEMFDDRLRIMEEELNMLIYPTFQETWLYENKRRVRDWLEANKFPHPQTWVFYDEDEAFTFLQKAKLPIVFKTNIGASAKGVRILRRRSDAFAHVRKAFRKGIVGARRDPRDRQWGVAYLQEFLPDVKEYRMIRIADSYFGYRKERIGDFHSGSGQFSFIDPPRILLDFLRDFTNKGNFTSMDVDIFETIDGRLLINELQTVFGVITKPPYMLSVNGKPGRYCFNENNGLWVFEEGDFSRNSCANARVDYLVNHLIQASKKNE